MNKESRGSVEGLDRLDGFDEDGFGEDDLDSSSSFESAASCFGVGGFGNGPCWRLRRERRRHFLR